MSSKKDRPKFSSNIKTHIFDNGLRLIYEHPHTSLPITSINTFCDIGSADEPENLRGAAHFIEHMCFKGTKKVPKASKIYLAYDDVGAILNAYTNKQFTQYVVKTAADYTHNCIDLMSDMILNSKFDRDQFVKEQKVVIEETLRSGDDAARDVADLTEAAIYKGSPYAFPIDHFDYHSKQPYDYADVVKLYRQFYQPDRMVVSVVSTLSFEEIKRMVEKSYFIKIKGTAGSLKIPPIQDNQGSLNLNGTVGSLNLVEKPNTKTIHLNVSFRTCNMYSDDRYVLDVLKHILSGTFGSLLSTLLREKNGLTYTSKAYTTYYEQSGDFTIYAQVDSRKILTSGPPIKHNKVMSKRGHSIRKNKTQSRKKSLPGVLPLIMKLLTHLVKHGITEKELTVAKHNIHGKMAIGLEDSMSQSAHNGRHLLLYPDEPVVPCDEYYDVHLKSITVKQVNDVIRKYFHNENMYVCMVGSIHKVIGKNESYLRSFIVI